MMQAEQLIYQGKGTPQLRGASQYRDTLPEYESPRLYYASSDLADAVNAAIFLEQPLLITGAPGAGKTQLAHSIAWEFGLPLHIFNTKMNSNGPDLFYRYDALLHFHDSHNTQVTPDPRKYVTYAALGEAILQSRPRSEVEEFLWTGAMDGYREATRSVVLVDEIDKAPRDFPNDILYETERLTFEVKETNWKPFEVNSALRPIIIVTSNQERNLPEAFLRRCVFYYIPAPGEDVLRSIVRRRLMPWQDGDGQSPAADDSKPLKGAQGELYEAALKRFMTIQSDQTLLKRPATAEMLNWMRALWWKGITADDVRSESGKLSATWGVLAKTKEDLERLHQVPRRIAAS